MDKNDIAAQAEKYKEEMMKLYGKSTSVPASVYASDEKKVLPQSEQQPDITTEPLEIPEPKNTVSEQPAPPAQSSRQAEEPQSTEVSPSEEQTDPEAEEMYPDSELNDIPDDMFEESETTENPLYSEDNLGTSVGYILVNVRTGEESDPVAGAVVNITAIHNGNRLNIASGTTDESGRTQRFEVPVPKIEYSLSPGSAVQPYSLFDVSVTAKGFFNARSVDVPVFEGITSLQNFSMIPVPLYMKSSDETVTNFNQEPNL